MLTDLFYILNFSFSILASIIGLLVSIIIIITVLTHRICRNPSNILICNTSLIVSTYFINTLIASIYGYREDWAEQQPLCTFRAYCFVVSCGSISYAYLIQAMSRLFFTVFYKNKNLQSYRTHFYLILGNWTFGIMIAIEPLFFEGSYTYEMESRMCTFRTNQFSSAIFIMILDFIVPLTSALIMYFMIVRRTRQSSRRVATMTQGATGINWPHFKRELKLIRRMLILMGIFVGCGTPFLIMILWQGIRPSSPPPSSFYLLTINAISFFIATMMITLFLMSKPIRQAFIGHFK